MRGIFFHWGLSFHPFGVPNIYSVLFQAMTDNDVSEKYFTYAFNISDTNTSTPFTPILVASWIINIAIW